jgi:hydrogenase-4 component F
MLILLFLASFVVALAAYFMKSESAVRTVSVIGSTVVALLTFSMTVPILMSGVPLMMGDWRIDMFAAILMSLVGFVQWTATLVSGPYIKEELHEKIIGLKQARMYYALLQMFVLSMMLTLSANNIGIMWISLEGTTLATTLLVAFYTYEGSLEAAWKYIVLCSVGISLGLLGVLLVFYAATKAGLGLSPDILTWTTLHGIATQLSPAIMRWAFVFIFIGYGAKVGLVPMHTWLPDAHGRTPSPVSGMLSGVLLNIALFSILRYKSLVDLSLGGSDWTNRLFLIFGALSFIVPAAFILVQRNYKRLLAYSSIEHMGFIVFCIGLGAPGMLAALVHLIAHSLIKSMLFFGTGNILLRWKSTKFAHVGPVMKSLPITGSIFLVGLLALLATPPSPIFFSELSAFSAGIGSHPLLVIGMLLAGTVIFAGMLRNLIPMLFSQKEDTVKAPVETWNISHAAMVLHLVAVVVFGVLLMSPSTWSFLTNIAHVI